MVSARSFLIRGLLAGLFAGIITFGVAYAVGEPSVDAAVALEQSGAAGHPHADGTAAHEHADPADETAVPRSLQSTVGLLSATVVAGATVGGLLGVLSALALGRFGGLGARATTLLVASIGFLTCTVLPFLAYPPNPPAVGQGDTIGLRTGLYFTLLAISVILGVTAVMVGRMLARTWGAWYAGIAAAGGYLLVAVVTVILLPTYDEVPVDFPATVLYDFRIASFGIQLTMWAVLGLVLAELVHRLVRRSSGLTQARTTQTQTTQTQTTHAEAAR